MMAFTKIVVMVPIWKCVGLTPVWSNFPDVHYFHTHILKITYRITYQMRPPQGTGSASGVKQT